MEELNSTTLQDELADIENSKAMVNIDRLSLIKKVYGELKTLNL